MSRRSFVELRLGKALTGWTADGSNYKRSTTAAELTFAGIIRAIVGVESLIAPRELVRVERVADMVAGTWYWDDANLVAGGSADLYVRLPTATDPDDASAGLVVQLLFCFGGGDENGAPEVHPLLGDNKFLNPGFEAWSGGNPTSWTEYSAGAAQETSVVLDGLSSARIGSASVLAGALDGVGQARVGVQGAFYRVSGYYRTPATGHDPDLEVRLRVGDGASWMLADGTSTTAVNGGFRLADTHGQTRRFLFDFVWPGATTATLQADLLLYNGSVSAAAGLLYVDRLQFRRIWRWNVYETNLAAAAVPELSIQSQSILFGAKTIGFGSVSILDGDGELAKAFASLLVLGKPARVYVGGSITEGDDVHREDWRGVFPAIIQKPTIEPGRIVLELENEQSLAMAKAAEHSHRVAEHADMSRFQENQAKPLVFGTPWDTGGVTLQHVIPGVRVDLTANGYGEYEYLDPLVPTRDAVDVDLPAGYSLKAFPNRDLADRNLQGYEITDSVNDFTVVNNNTRWRILRDIRNYRYNRSGEDVGTGSVFTFGIGSFEVITGTNDLIDVKIGATTELAVLTAGKYTGPGLAAEVEARLDAIGSFGDFDVDYNLDSGLFTITYNGGGGTPSFLTKTGANAGKSPLDQLMGFRLAPHVIAATTARVDAADIDWVGQMSYTGSDPVFGVTVYSVTVDVEGPAYAAALAIQTAMRAAAGTSRIDVTYNEATHLWTFLYYDSHAIFTLIMRAPELPGLESDTAPVAPQKESYRLLGFDTSVDRTGSLTYTGDEPTFTDPDGDHVLRFAGGGYRDDAAGSICGVPNAAIDSWPAASSWLLQKRLNVPASRVNVPSFADAREQTRDFDFAIIFATIEEGAVLEALAIGQRVGIYNLVPDGEGVWQCIRHKATTAGAREFFDEDYIAGSWRMWLDRAAIYRDVRVLGDWNPSQKRFMTFGDATGVLDPLIPIKYSDERPLDIPSYIERQFIVAGTQQVANHYARLIKRVPRVVTFEARSKLVDLLPGHKVILNRTAPGVLDPTGELAAVAFRIADLTHRYSTTGISRCVAVEDVEFLT